ncbi:MAG: DUF4886 domain-containing protein [Lentisphaeria bacterium]|nr:DUF4886 domain-containing protein [Lentisphaeria bacterium]
MKSSLNILTIGNSFADSAVRAIIPIARYAGVKLNIQKANVGGCELRRHWAYITAEQKNPVDCRIYSYGPLSKLLSETEWDIVTIQQASHESWKRDTFQPYATNIFNFVKELAPQAEVVIQQTWAYRADHPQFREGSEWGISQEEMYKLLTGNYKNLSSELGNLRIIPSGYAVQLARKMQPVKFKALSQQEEEQLNYPDIPPQAGALVGKYYYEKDGDGEFVPKADKIHLNTRGEYLQGMVWFGMLFECDVTGLDFIPENISKSDAAFLRQIAQKAIDSAKNIPENV